MLRIGLIRRLKKASGDPNRRLKRCLIITVAHCGIELPFIIRYLHHHRHHSPLWLKSPPDATLSFMYRNRMEYRPR